MDNFASTTLNSHLQQIKTEQQKQTKALESIAESLAKLIVIQQLRN